MSLIRQLPIREELDQEPDQADPDEHDPGEVADPQPRSRRLASQIKTSAPTSPLSDSYRKSGWKWV